MTKKKVHWYGIRTFGYDLSIIEVEVVRETPKRIQFAENQGDVYFRKSVLKASSYERWFPVRDEAVAEKLKMLKRDLKTTTDSKTEAKNRLTEFKEKENV